MDFGRSQYLQFQIFGYFIDAVSLMVYIFCTFCLKIL